MTSNKKVLAFIEETKALCDPKEVVWVDGSEEQLEAFRKQAVEEGILIKLNQEKLPGCYLHRTTQNDVPAHVTEATQRVGGEFKLWTLAEGTSGFACLNTAMANAPEKVKNIADYVTVHDNDHHGVVEVIRRFF